MTTLTSFKPGTIVYVWTYKGDRYLKEKGFTPPNDEWRRVEGPLEVAHTDWDNLD